MDKPVYTNHNFNLVKMGLSNRMLIPAYRELKDEESFNFDRNNFYITVVDSNKKKVKVKLF